MIAVKAERGQVNVSFPTKGMSPDEVNDFVTWLRVEGVARRSKLTKETALQLGEDIKAGWWKEKEHRLRVTWLKTNQEGTRPVLAWIFACILAFASSERTSAQGSFINLNFEQARIIPIPDSMYYPWAVATTNALPGWIAYVRGLPTDWIIHDTISIGSPWVSIHDAGGYAPVLEGSYSVFLQPFFSTVAVGQVGVVPSTARSVRFFGIGGFMVSFADEQIPLSALETTSSYTLYGGDVSAFAGRSGELRIQGGGGFSTLDNVFFSAQPIPEPCGWGLFGTAVFFIAQRWKKQDRPRATRLNFDTERVKTLDVSN